MGLFGRKKKKEEADSDTDANAFGSSTEDESSGSEMNTSEAESDTAGAKTSGPAASGVSVGRRRPMGATRRRPGGSGSSLASRRQGSGGSGGSSRTMSKGLRTRSLLQGRGGINSIEEFYDAIRSNEKMKVQTALKAGTVDPNQEYMGTVPLLYACEHELWEMAYVLVKEGAELDVVVPEGDEEGASVLHLAAGAGDVTLVTTVMSKRNELIEARDAEGLTPLMYAARAGHQTIVQALITHSADIDAVSAERRNALHFAAEYGAEEAAALLLRNGINVNAQDDTNTTAVHLAARNGYNDILQMLAGAGADFTLAQTDGASLLHEASEYDEPDTIQWIIKNGYASLDEPTADGSTALHLAAQAGREEAVVKLLDLGAKVDMPAGEAELTPLMLALTNSHTNACARLISSGANVNYTAANGMTPLHVAAQTGNYDVLYWLLDRGADARVVDAGGNTPLHYAFAIPEPGADGEDEDDEEEHEAEEEEEEEATRDESKYVTYSYCAMRLLQELDVNVTNELDGNQPIHMAAHHGYVAGIDVLVNAGADIRARNASGATPLHLACYSGRIEAFFKLVELGGEAAAEVMNAQTDAGVTPLIMACLGSHSTLVYHMLDAGADMTLADEEGRTALHYAAATKDENSVVWLLEKGMDANVCAKGGNTPLHFCARSDSANCALFLMREGADPHMLSEAKLTVVQECVAYNSLETLELLISASEEVGRPLDLTATCPDGMTPFQTAIRYSAQGAANKLVELGVRIDQPADNGWTALHTAARYGIANMVEYLNSQAVLMNLVTKKERYTAVHLAAMSFDNHSLRLFLEHDVDVNAKDADGHTALHYLCSLPEPDIPKSPFEQDEDAGKEEPEVVEQRRAACLRSLLGDGSADQLVRDDDNNLALHLAAEQGLDGAVKILLQGYAKPRELLKKQNKHGSALHNAARGGHVDTLRVLLEAQADVNLARTTDGYTAVAEAAEECQWEAVQVLLEHNAVRVDWVDKQGRGLLYRLLGLHRSEEEVREAGGIVQAAVMTVVSRGAPRADGQGSSVLHAAAAQDRVEAITLLLDAHVCQASDLDEEGRTPLHVAAAAGAQAAVRALLEHGKVDPEATDAAGRTAEKLAADKGHQAVVTLLQEWGKSHGGGGAGNARKTAMLEAADTLSDNEMQLSEDDEEEEEEEEEESGRKSSSRGGSKVSTRASSKRVSEAEEEASRRSSPSKKGVSGSSSSSSSSSRHSTAATTPRGGKMSLRAGARMVGWAASGGKGRYGDEEEEEEEEREKSGRASGVDADEEEEKEEEEEEGRKETKKERKRRKKEERRARRRERRRKRKEAKNEVIGDLFGMDDGGGGGSGGSEEEGGDEEGGKGLGRSTLDASAHAAMGIDELTQLYGPELAMRIVEERRLEASMLEASRLEGGILEASMREVELSEEEEKALAGLAKLQRRMQRSLTELSKRLVVEQDTRRGMEVAIKQIHSDMLSLWYERESGEGQGSSGSGSSEGFGASSSMSSASNAWTSGNGGDVGVRGASSSKRKAMIPLATYMQRMAHQTRIYGEGGVRRGRQLGGGGAPSTELHSACAHCRALMAEGKQFRHGPHRHVLPGRAAGGGWEDDEDGWTSQQEDWEHMEVEDIHDEDSDSVVDLFVGGESMHKSRRDMDRYLGEIRTKYLYGVQDELQHGSSSTNSGGGGSGGGVAGGAGGARRRRDAQVPYGSTGAYANGSSNSVRYATFGSRMELGHAESHPRTDPARLAFRDKPWATPPPTKPKSRLAMSMRHAQSARKVRGKQGPAGSATGSGRSQSAKPRRPFQTAGAPPSEEMERYREEMRQWQVRRRTGGAGAGGGGLQALSVAVTEAREDGFRYSAV